MCMHAGEARVNTSASRAAGRMMVDGLTAVQAGTIRVRVHARDPFLEALVTQPSRSRRAARIVSILMVLAALFFPFALCAQLDTGSITGVVRDSTGAVIPGAKIMLTNTATGVPVATASTAPGDYTFSDLTPGAYRIEAEAK